MLNHLITLAMKQRSAVLLGMLLLVGIGTWSAINLPIDAVPDITNPQVQINTAVSALAPEEVEKLVTFPLEMAMTGMPDMVELRSLSKFGLSQVTMIFHDDVDIYRIRQLVAERLQGVLDELPTGLAPKLAPIATGLGEIFHFSVDYAEDAPHKPATREAQLMELAQIQEYQVQPLLRGTPGVAEVNTIGGYRKQIVIQPDPMRLAARGLSLDMLAAIVEQHTRNAGGSYVEIGGEQLIIRAATRVNSIEEILTIPLKFTGGVTPIHIGDVATVSIGSAFRTGAATEDGREGVIGSAIMLAGANSRLAARTVRTRLEESQEKLPEGVVIQTLYDRSTLVSRTIATVEKNLVEGALLVVVVLFALLGNFRAAFIVALVIPLSMLFAMTGMVRYTISGNLMSLGAVDFGLIIDGAVVMVENIVRHLGERQHMLGRRLTLSERTEEVLKSAKEVANPMFFGVMIITVVYVPILALQGIEGKMFKPMALVVMLALGGSLVLAITLMPVLCSYFLGGDIKEKDNWIVTVTKRCYTPLLQFGLRFKKLVVLSMLVLLGSSAWVMSRMGSEFIPQLDEGDFTFQLIRSSSVGITASVDLQKRSETLIRRDFPEVVKIFSRIGTAELATDPMNPNVADTYLMLKPRDQWRQRDGKPIAKQELGELMKNALLEQVPGQNVMISQPIQMRFNEIMAGARADLVCKIFGDSYEELERLAGEVRTVVTAIHGGRETEFDNIGRNPMIEIHPNRVALGKFNVHTEELNRVIEAAMAGDDVGMVIEGNKRIPIVVRLTEQQRRDLEVMKRLAVRTDDGGLLALSQVAEIKLVPQPVQISRENTQRRVILLINVRDRNTSSFVEEATRAIREKVKFPDGYYFEFGGQFENLQEAKARLTIVVPLAMTLIFVLIFLSFGSIRQAALIFMCVPLATTGGIFALSLRGMPFTISAAVGFIALSGIAVLNGIMLISFINQLRGEGMPLRDAVVEGTLTRLRPKLMTALVASLGFVPMAIATGAGAEVQRPIATVVIGGIITSTFLTLLVVPVLYDWIERKGKPQTNPP